VVPPIAPGAANVAPLKLDAFKFGTLVVLEITNGAVPVVSVDVI
jgi:succinate-acetate transporter protein